VAAGTVAAFWAVSFMFVITPGADWAYAISAGLRHRTVVPAVGGLLTGHLLATAVVAAGVATVVARTPSLMTTLTVAGAVYLVWLGARLLSGPEAAPAAGDDFSEGSWWRQAGTGLGVSGLNPKVLILFAALLPQWVDTSATWPAWSQIVALGLVHVASCAVIYTLVGLGARRVLRARPGAAVVVTRVSGTVMVVLGSVLIVEHLV
jgi:threonine/homoserine/homoserine lactone efflux protein